MISLERETYSRKLVNAEICKLLNGCSTNKVYQSYFCYGGDT